MTRLAAAGTGQLAFCAKERVRGRRSPDNHPEIILFCVCGADARWSDGRDGDATENAAVWVLRKEKEKLENTPDCD
jgi:hypothetical protein